MEREPDYVLSGFKGDIYSIGDGTELFFYYDENDIVSRIVQRGVGSSQEPWSSSWMPLAELPVGYGAYENIEQAVLENVYVNVQGAEIYNQNMVDVFYESVFAGNAAFMRAISYTVEGDPIITDYECQSPHS
ncbi:MAG: DUF4362 domain-containing protein [Clostridiales bacterium]|jgi:hypothetical protein|nr:DUF4362 domain-containing protein [Clostridiales bacterium]